MNREQMKLTDEELKKINDDYFLLDMRAIAEGTNRPDIFEFAKSIVQAQLDKYLSLLNSKKLREKIAKYIYEYIKKWSVRLPEAPTLPTWEQLKSDKGTLREYNKRLVERYLLLADRIISLLLKEEEK